MLCRTEQQSAQQKCARRRLWSTSRSHVGQDQPDPTYLTRTSTLGGLKVGRGIHAALPRVLCSFFQNSSGRTTGQPRQTRPGSCTADRPSCTTMMTHFRASTFCRGFKCGGVFYQVKKYISAITSYTGTTRIPTGPETTYYVCMYNNTAAPAWTCTVLGTTRAIQAAGRNQPRIFISCFFCLFPFFCILKSFRRKLIYMQESLYFAT